MADITVLARLLNGAVRNVDLSTNTPVVLSVKLSTNAGVTSTELTKAILDSLITNSHAPMSDNQDVVAGAGLTGGGTGATTTLDVGAGSGISVSANAVAVDSTVIRTAGTNAFSADQSMGSNKITNLANGTVSGDAVNFGQVSALISGGGQVKVSAADTTSEYLSASIVAGAALTSNILNAGANEQLNLDVQVDGSSIEVSSDALRVKASGITNAMLAGSIDATKIADGSVTSTEFQYINSLTSNAQTQIDAKVAKSGSSMDSAANITFSGGGEILGLPSTPSSAGSAASKAYVDAVALGLAPKKAVYVATTAPGTLATSFAAGQTVDTVTLSAGMRILIKNQALAKDNGIYVVQASGAPVRSTDMDSISPIDEVNGAWVPVQFGSQAGQIYVQYGVVTTIGTDSITFEFYNPLAALVGGDMITNSGSTFSVDLSSDAGLESTVPGDVSGQLRVKLDGSTLARSSSGMKVSALGITASELAATSVTKTKIAADVAGNGLGQNVDGSLEINVDNSTVEISTDILRVKDLGISAAKLAADSVTTVKILDGNVTLAKLASNSVDENKIVSTTFNAAGAITGGGGTKVAVQVDSSTIEISSNALRIKDAGVTLAKLASASVDENKLTASVAGNGLTGGAGTALAVGAHADGSIVVAADTIQVASAPALKSSEVAGESFAASLFAVRYAKAADAGFVAGRVYKAAIDASVSDNFYVVGLVNSAASAAGAIITTKLGSMTVTGHGFTVGSPLFLDAAGAVTSTAPSTSGNAVVRVGFAKDANTIDVQIQVMGVN
ncbi:Coiled stalk of trimeric autotransporter adhesin [uncultured Caudovirales phage]|uniref:Coiled stalk of trimeric autotransporter adhesin n=1 Tax=uncultured Caudovirales phage TaxID=2100421 RepID=A0A6J5KXX1_9CAUD|nr:Coiled stalk of trimeric autotransporter adhesin [uncultured Caudovirales phage]